MVLFPAKKAKSVQRLGDLPSEINFATYISEYSRDHTAYRARRRASGISPLARGKHLQLILESN